MESRRAGVIAAPAGTLAAVPDAVQAAAAIRAAGDVLQQDRVHALPVGVRLFLDVVRMIAYRRRSGDRPHERQADHGPQEPRVFPGIPSWGTSESWRDYSSHVFASAPSHYRGSLGQLRGQSCPS